MFQRNALTSRLRQLIQQNGIFHVSHTIETVITHLAMNRQQRQNLKDELATLWRDHPEQTDSWTALQKLPYLTACIYEGLRLGAGSMKRSPRVFPEEDIPYKNWVIPRNVSSCGFAFPFWARVVIKLMVYMDRCRSQ